MVRKKREKHGHTYVDKDGIARASPTYVSWSRMKQRCLDPANKYYADYGGRGIKICEEWVNSFVAFLRDMGERPEGKTIDRIDVYGDYCLANCRWATKSEQERNKRRKAA